MNRFNFFIRTKPGSPTIEVLLLASEEHDPGETSKLDICQEEIELVVTRGWSRMVGAYRMRANMQMCIYIYIHLQIHYITSHNSTLHICNHMRVSLFVVCTCVLCVCLYTKIYRDTHVYIYIYIDMYKHAYIYMYVRTHIRVSACAHLRVRLRVPVCVLVRVCVCTCVRRCLSRSLSLSLSLFLLLLFLPTSLSLSLSLSLCPSVCLWPSLSVPPLSLCS